MDKHFKILDFNTNNEFNKDNIKECYKKIALCCHPDKLNNIKDDKEKEEKIEKFKEATISYNYLLNYLNNGGKDINNFDFYDNLNEFNDFKDFVNMPQYFNIFRNFSDLDDMDVFEFNFESEENIKKSVFNTMTDIASMFLKQNIKTKSYYNPGGDTGIGNIRNTKNDILKHNIELPVNINDVYSNKKKKLELILKKIKEPVNMDVYCGHNKINKQYIDDDCIEHDIIINLKIVKNNKHKILKNYNHIERDDGTIDLITTVEISLLDYLEGSIKKIVFIDGSIIKLNIPSFENDKIIKRRRGLYGGNLIVNIYLKNIIRSEWNTLNKECKDNMIRILKTI